MFFVKSVWPIAARLPIVAIPTGASASPTVGSEKIISDINQELKAMGFATAEVLSIEPSMFEGLPTASIVVSVGSGKFEKNRIICLTTENPKKGSNTLFQPGMGLLFESHKGLPEYVKVKNEPLFFVERRETFLWNEPPAVAASVMNGWAPCYMAADMAVDRAVADIYTRILTGSKKEIRTTGIGYSLGVDLILRSNEEKPYADLATIDMTVRYKDPTLLAAQEKELVSLETAMLSNPCNTDMASFSQIAKLALQYPNANILNQNYKNLDYFRFLIGNTYILSQNPLTLKPYFYVPWSGNGPLTGIDEKKFMELVAGGTIENGQFIPGVRGTSPYSPLALDRDITAASIGKSPFDPAKIKKVTVVYFENGYGEESSRFYCEDVKSAGGKVDILSYKGGHAEGLMCDDSGKIWGDIARSVIKMKK